MAASRASGEPVSAGGLGLQAGRLAFLSTTSDKGVAERFNRLRTSDASEARSCWPEQAVVADCNLRFPSNGQHNDGPIFMAQAMEDKWDFYTYDRRLYVRRSWSCFLTHVAELEYLPDAVVVRRIHAEPNTIYGDRDFAVKQLHFLMATHLGRAVMPFPIPPGFPRAWAKSIALAGFNAYGRHAQYAGCFGA